ncbi:MAG: hypothetical protein Q7U16_12145 [Agitococcus sp.]|nr:hypothetical protein [Agitococcus sp.]
MKSDFEFAYALFLTDGDYRKMMIDCGVKALQDNMDGMYLALLAGGDFDDTQTLLKNFKKAALECGFTLPNESEFNDWLVVQNLNYALQNNSLLDVNKEFELNLCFIYRRISEWAEDSVKKFIFQFGKFTHCTGAIDNYGDWIDNINDLTNNVEISEASDFQKKVVITLMKIIDDVSYSVVSAYALNESRNSVRLLQ